MSSLGEAVGLTHSKAALLRRERKAPLPWYSGFLVSIATPHLKLLANQDTVSLDTSLSCITFAGVKAPATKREQRGSEGTETS